VFRGAVQVTALFMDYKSTNASRSSPRLFHFAKSSLGRNCSCTSFSRALLFCQGSQARSHLELRPSQAHLQFTTLQNAILNLPNGEEQDKWTYIWGGAILSTAKAYKSIIGQGNIHPIFHWLWKSKCQMKHKFFLFDA
jgi:hypothetical protein